MNIAVIGAGYVGLVTATCFADLGHQVINVDNDRRKTNLLKKGQCHFYEPGLEDLVRHNLKEKRLSFTENIKIAVEKSQVIFIAVGTPPREDGGADLSQIETVARIVASKLTSQYKLIIEKSTVPVRTGTKIKETIEAHASKKAEFDVASNPEFLREGTAIQDFMHPDRIVVGADSEKAKKVIKQLYKDIKATLLITDLNSAELIKHASNSFLAMKISFINAIARICDVAHANVEEVARGMGMDKRIGHKFLNPGIGYGGFCFPKDVSAFIHICDHLGYDFKLLKAVRDINDDQIYYFLKKVEDKLWNVKDKHLAILGLSFKPNTDDMRFAPSILIIEYLLNHGAKITAFDPKAMPNAQKVFGKKIRFVEDPYEAFRNKDAALILTDWNEFKNLDLKKVKKLMKKPVILDGRNMYDPKAVKAAGIDYVSIGRL